MRANVSWRPGVEARTGQPGPGSRGRAADLAGAPLDQLGRQHDVTAPVRRQPSSRASSMSTACSALGRRVLADRGEARLEQVGGGEVVEADDRHPPLQARLRSARTAPTLITLRPQNSAVGGSSRSSIADTTALRPPPRCGARVLERGVARPGRRAPGPPGSRLRRSTAVWMPQAVDEPGDPPVPVLDQVSGPGAGPAPVVDGDRVDGDVRRRPVDHHHPEAGRAPRASR